MQRAMNRMLALSLFVVVWGAGYAPAHPVQAQDVGKAWEFNRDGDFEGVLPSDRLADVTVEGGVLRARVVGDFPSLRTDTFRIQAARYGIVQLRARLTGATSLVLIWDNDRGSWGFSRIRTNADSSFHTYWFPVHLSSRWVGNILRLARVEFNAPVGSQIEIDFVRIVHRGPIPSIAQFVPLRSVIKPNAAVPFLAVVRNIGDEPADFQSELLLPAGAVLENGDLHREHGTLYGDLADTTEWAIRFPEVGDYEVKLRLYSDSVSAEKAIQVHVTNQFWKQEEFLLSAWSPPYAWYGPPFEDSVFTYYKNANFDIILWVRDSVDLMAKVRAHGFKYFLLVTPIFGDERLRGSEHAFPPDISEDMLQQLDRLIDKYRDDPNLLGYHLCDEPHMNAFSNIAKVVRRIRQKDPTRLSFVNIWPNVADNRGGPTYIDSLLQTTKLELLSYDRYPFHNDKDKVWDYFSNLALIRRYARKYDIPFCNIIQAIGTNGTSMASLGWRTPGEAEHRWLVYTSLAYGVHALIWFHWHGDWGVTGSPDREQIYASLRKVNAEIHAIGKVMVRLTTTAVYHTKPENPAWQLPASDIIRSVSENANLVVGYFQDAEGNPYFMLTNKDYTSPVTATITLNGSVEGLRYFDVSTNRWRDVPHRDTNGNAVLEVHLRAGGGKLFTFSRLSAVMGGESERLPKTFRLEQNYPNPFNPGTTIRYALPLGTKGRVQLVVYDLLGRQVASLVDEKQEPGRYSAYFDARGLPAGLYFYRLSAPGFTQTRKMVCVR